MIRMKTANIMVTIVCNVKSWSETEFKVSKAHLMSSSIFACASKSKGSAVMSLILSCSLLARSCCCSSSTLVKRSVEKHRQVRFSSK